MDTPGLFERTRNAVIKQEIERRQKESMSSFPSHSDVSEKDQQEASVDRLDDLGEKIDLLIKEVAAIRDLLCKTKPKTK